MNAIHGRAKAFAWLDRLLITRAPQTCAEKRREGYRLFLFCCGSVVSIAFVTSRALAAQA